MYEHLRNDFLAKLSTNYGIEDINKIAAILDSVVKDYDITQKTTELAIWQGSQPQELKIYLASKRVEGLSNNSLSLYALYLRTFFETVQKTPQEVTANDVRLFLATYQAQHKIVDRSLDKIRQIINQFFSWLTDEEYITKNPCRTIKAIKCEKKRRQALTRYQLELLRNMITDKRELAILDMLFSTGCRVTELVNMRITDIDLQARTAKIIGKGNKHNTVYLNDRAYISMQDYLTTRKGDSDYLFISIRSPYDQLTSRSVEHILKKYEKPLGVPLSPHIIRHTMATLSLQAGAPITDIQKMLGHSNLATTQIYAETSQESVRQAHTRYVV